MLTATPAFICLIMQVLLVVLAEPVPEGNNRHDRNHGESVFVERNACYVLANNSSQLYYKEESGVTSKKVTITYIYELQYDKDGDPKSLVHKIKQSIEKAVSISIVRNSCESKEESSDDIKIQLSFDSRDIYQDGMACEPPLPQNKCIVYLGRMTIYFLQDEGIYQKPEVDQETIDNTRSIAWSIIKNVIDSGELSSKHPELIDFRLESNRSFDDKPVITEGDFIESVETTAENDFTLFGKLLLAGSASLLLSGLVFAVHRRTKQSLVKTWLPSSK